MLNEALYDFSENHSRTAACREFRKGFNVALQHFIPQHDPDAVVKAFIDTVNQLEFSGAPRHLDKCVRVHYEDLGYGDAKAWLYLKRDPEDVALDSVFIVERLAAGRGAFIEVNLMDHVHSKDKFIRYRVGDTRWHAR